MNNSLFLRADRDRIEACTKDPIYGSLDCFNRALYYLIQQNIKQSEFFFLNSLYPYFYKDTKENYWEIFFREKHCTDNRGEFFEVEDLKVLDRKDFIQIKERIQSGHYIVISGDFRKINYFSENPYGFWGDEHTVLVLGYDEEYLYFHDNLAVIMPEAKIGGCSRVKEEHLLKVMKSDSRIMDLKFKKEVPCDHELILQQFLHEMIAMGAKKEVIQRGGSYYLTGVDVFQYLVEELQTDSGIEQTRFFGDANIAHEIMIKRQIFLMCLREIEKAERYGELIQSLQEDIAGWQRVKMLILRNSRRPEEHFSQKAIECIRRIIELEAQLFYTMDKTRE